MDVCDRREHVGRVVCYLVKNVCNLVQSHYVEKVN